MTIRNIILHCHFFKNAGTTIDWALKRSFVNSLYEYKGELSIPDWNKYLESILKEPAITAVLSHIFTLRPPAIEGIKLHLISMFRHPVERVTSVAAFEKKRHYRNSKGIIKDANVGIKGYIKAYLRNNTPASIRNMHTLRYAGDDKGQPATKEDFNKAVDTVEHCKTIGLVEAFDESMVLFEEHLKPIFPNLDLAYVIQNVHQQQQSIEQRIENLRSQLGEELFEILLAKNDKDLRLYEIVKGNFYERINCIENFSEKLKFFRKRCSDLQVPNEP